MDLKLSDEQLNTIVQAAVMGAISPENREKLIATAIVNLLERPGLNSPTQLQSIFNDAVTAVARKYVEETLATQKSFTDRIDALITEATAKFFAEGNRAKIIESISIVMRKALTGERY